MAAVDQTTSTYTWSPPIFNLSIQPEVRQTYAIRNDGNGNEIHNFARNVRWTPDGSVFMTHCENQTFQLFANTGQRVFNHEHHSNTKTAPNTSDTNRQNPSEPTLILHQPAPILDFTWFPGASPTTDPSSFCFLASVRECPVKLIDASDGRLRASYKIIDHRERFVAPHCMTFNLDASKIYCGHESAIEIFDMSRPGEGTRILTSPSRKSKDGLKGIVSALSFSPNYTTSSETFYAAGTLNPTLSNLAIYTESQPEVPVMFVGGGERAAVTQLRFNPVNPHILYASYRRRGIIYAWDLRSDVNTPLTKYLLPDPDKPKTNQKMIFDVDVTGQKLAVGDQTGNLYVFDLNSIGENTSATTTTTTSIRLEAEETFDGHHIPDLSIPNAHSDSIGSVAFHPYQPLLLSVSGSRHYHDPHNPEFDLDRPDPILGSESESESEDSEEEQEEMGEVRVSQRKSRMRPLPRDSSIKLWDFGR